MNAINFKRIISFGLIISLIIGFININLNIHKCSKDGDFYYQILLGNNYDNDCDKCHQEEKKVKSCCAMKESSEKNDNCCQERIITINDNITKIISFIKIKIDSNLFIIYDKIDIIKSLKFITYVVTGQIPKPPDILLKTQSFLL